ncbi:MAG TPA: hypothetical protein VJ866_05500 [Pyrinomonadaceae bacterium]|nr:hypothetical protein [Pyrinomonadaceae bacterium]
MKTTSSLLAFTFVLLSLSLAARAQQPAAAPDYGTLDGSVYTNRFFGLTLNIPEGWLPQGEHAKQEIREKGRELIGPDDPEVERNARRVFNLLTVFRYPPGTSGPVNPTLLCSAERLPAAGVTDAVYMAGLKRLIQSTRARVTVDRDVYAETLGGQTFSVIVVTSEFRGAVTHHKFYARIMKGYALTISLSYATPEPLPEQTAALKSVRFR